MSTNQPRWKFKCNLGDVDPLEHDGLFVYEDETGVYQPEMERLERLGDDNYLVYRVVLDRCAYVDGRHLVHDKDFAKAEPAKYIEWFSRDLKSVASFVGRKVAELITDLCSEDVQARALAYQDIYSYHGWENGDSEPLTLTREEAEARYKRGELS